MAYIQVLAVFFKNNTVWVIPHHRFCYMNISLGVRNQQYLNTFDRGCELQLVNTFSFLCRVNDPVAAKLLRKAGEMPSLAAPEDMSSKTLHVGGLVDRVTEEDLKDQFYSYE